MVCKEARNKYQKRRKIKIKRITYEDDDDEEEENGRQDKMKR